jgi:hypothetical protein
MMSTHVVTTLVKFFQMLGRFIAFVVGCDFRVTYSIKCGTKTLVTITSPCYAMKIIVQTYLHNW